MPVINLRCLHRCRLSSPRFTSFMVDFSSAVNKVSCKLLICGGGAGGCSIAAKYAAKLGFGGCVVVEPSDTHYYQPMWTMVGGGLKKLEQSGRPMSSVLPKMATWIKESVVEFIPEKNQVITTSNIEISYEFMVVALGLELHYEAIPGLVEGLSTEGSGICSNYHPKYVTRTFPCVKNFRKGNAIFTLPSTPIKCAGAAQKACYISEALLRRYGRRHNAKVKYKTSLPQIFCVKKYADKLWEVCERRIIEVGLRQELIEVKPHIKEAVFKYLDAPSREETERYEMLHVCPPMSAPASLKKTPKLSDAAGFLSVNKWSLQHTEFPNIFGIGDCTNLPTSKTAAAVAAQGGVLKENLDAVMKNQQPTATYNGYTSCPLITDLDRCILAEFNYSLEPIETFPFDQGKERYTSFLLTKEIIPLIYWNGLLNGHWNGPATFRTLFHLGLK